VPELNDDQRQAASIIPAISSNIGTASLGALAGLIALYTYLAQTYKLDALFYGAAVLAAVCLIGSLVLGGWGTKKLVEKVAGGGWKVSDGIFAYRLQTGTAVAGLVLIGLATVIAVKAPHLIDKTAQDVQRLDERVAVLEHQRHEGVPFSHALDRIEDDDTKRR
jgi:predicted lysophospholipase L1 biosynthesis ABC-type transport system permease subunit